MPAVKAQDENCKKNWREWGLLLFPRHCRTDWGGLKISGMKTLKCCIIYAKRPWAMRYQCLRLTLVCHPKRCSWGYFHLFRPGLQARDILLESYVQHGHYSRHGLDLLNGNKYIFSWSQMQSYRVCFRLCNTQRRWPACFQTIQAPLRLSFYQCSGL